MRCREREPLDTPAHGAAFPKKACIGANGKAGCSPPHSPSRIVPKGARRWKAGSRCGGEIPGDETEPSPSWISPRSAICFTRRVSTAGQIICACRYCLAKGRQCQSLSTCVFEVPISPDHRLLMQGASRAHADMPCVNGVPHVCMFHCTNAPSPFFAQHRPSLRHPAFRAKAHKTQQPRARDRLRPAGRGLQKVEPSDKTDACLHEGFNVVPRANPGS